MDVSAFTVPGAGRGILDLFKYRYLLRLLIRKGILTRYHGSVLGWLWSYVKPAAQFAVFYVVMGVFLNLTRGIESYPIYLFSGIVVINLFNEAFGNATRSIVSNKALVKKIYLPRELFPIADVFIALVHFLPAAEHPARRVPLRGLGADAARARSAPCSRCSSSHCSRPGSACCSARSTWPIRDAQNIVELILLFATWTSPVLYSWTMVRDQAPDVALRPLHGQSADERPSNCSTPHSGSRRRARPPSDPNPLAVHGDRARIAVLCLIIGQLVFRRLEGRFAQDL